MEGGGYTERVDGDTDLTAVLLLSPVIVKETKKYIKNLDAVDHTPIPVVKTGRGKRR